MLAFYPKISGASSVWTALIELPNKHIIKMYFVTSAHVKANTTARDAIAVCTQDKLVVYIKSEISPCNLKTHRIPFVSKDGYTTIPEQLIIPV